ncbi:putative bifunctional diguanylate cyclase/phosphodiesterase [Rhizobium sp. G187]|uniref:putative bifunctional diguanylate cyclase/phosphodiesterase n=1 Tax=Rhizobium sp. G187 TaxID=3451352 RepID=UPI003EE6C7D7
MQNTTTDRVRADASGASDDRGAEGSLWTVISPIKALKRQYGIWTSATRRRAMAEAYRPIMRGFLLPGWAYYLFVTWGHWRDETGFNFYFLGGLSLATAIAYAVFRWALLPAGRTPLRRLETVGLATNLLMYLNVVAYMQTHSEPQKLIYFVLMAVVFSTTGVTLRATLLSVTLSIGTMFWFASKAPPEVLHQFAFIGVASSFASFGMATLLRKAILRQIDARLLADQLAARDSLTGIANRRSIFANIDRLVQEQRPFWVGILDLDGFKSINDIYGHAVGDQVLCEVVERLGRREMQGIEIGRIGGDEFAILIQGETESTQIEVYGNFLIKDISRSYDMHPLRLNLSGTIGFAHFPTMGKTAREIYEKADFALYRGKQFARRQTTVFTTSQDEEMRETLALERALREAKLEDELYLLFQPQVDLNSNRVVSFEALARWQSPALGLVPPDRFIRAAERAGLIQSVTRVLFGKALNALDLWPADISISFNLSAQDLAECQFIMSLVSEVRDRGVDPARVEFEITETAVIKDVGASRSVLQELSAAGFKIALDDFGSGYSSFEYLDQLPLNKVKIDKSFVRKVSDNPTCREIVAAIIALCDKLELKCVLEGVETDEQMQTLAPLKPQMIQGYLFGRPISQRDVLALLLELDEVQTVRLPAPNVVPPMLAMETRPR